MKADILLRGGTVVDGTGEPGYAADVAIADGRIVAIGDLSPSEAHRVIDVTGLVVAPGFIDIHTHSDLTVIVDPRCESKVRQGVTTDVTGNCGSSPFPLAPERIELHRNHLQEIDESVLGWTDLAGYSQVIERRPISFNVAPLVGHGTLRTAGMGHDRRAPTPQELATMKQLLVEQLTQGAFGFSTGLTLVPGAYADEEELVELVSVVAEHDALYATHTRGNGKGEFSGVELAVRTATRAGARLQFSHAAINTPDLWGRAADVTDILEGARANGLDVMFDVYPYDASSSGMTQFLPTWVLEGGTEAMRARLSDPAVYRRALDELRSGFWGIPWFWDRVVLSRVPDPDAHLVGSSIQQAAARTGADPAEWALQLCLDHGNSARVVLFYRTEEDMMTFLAHPLSMVGSGRVRHLVRYGGRAASPAVVRNLPPGLRPLRAREGPVGPQRSCPQVHRRRRGAPRTHRSGCIERRSGGRHRCIRCRHDYRPRHLQRASNSSRGCRTRTRQRTPRGRWWGSDRRPTRARASASRFAGGQSSVMGRPGRRLSVPS